MHFQLTLKDLYELEKIKDVEMRNEILDKASSSRDIVSRVQNEITNAKKKENAKKLKAEAEKRWGVEKATGAVFPADVQWKVENGDRD